MTNINPDKLKLIRLFNGCLDRSGLKLEAIVARVQNYLYDKNTHLASKITLHYIQNRFTARPETMYDIDPDLMLATVAGFTKSLVKSERCTPSEIMEFVKLTNFPENSLGEMRELFPSKEEREEFDKAWKRVLEEKRDTIQRKIEVIKQQGQSSSPRKYISPQEGMSPLSQEDLDLFKELDDPIGALSLDNQFYIRREEDNKFERLVTKRRTIITIRSAGQTGKSSLLERGLHYAHQEGLKVIKLNLQEIDKVTFSSLDKFFRFLAEFIAKKLDLDRAEVARIWEQELLLNEKLNQFIEKHVLSTGDSLVVLAIDEADRLFKEMDSYTEFFGLIRAWHSKGANEDEWKRLNIVLVISTKPHLFNRGHQSPFNVSRELNLQDFNETQVRTLAQQYEVPIEEDDLASMMGLLQGHPYLTHLALYTIVTEGSTWAALMQEATSDDGPFGNHLRDLHKRLLDNTGLREALKQIIRHGSCTDERALYHLLQAGLVRERGEAYTLRCDLYRLYFERRLLR